MTIKLRNIANYALFPAGMAYSLPSEQVRRIRLSVNCEMTTRFDVIRDGEVTFLATVEGLKELEFVVEGPCEVVATSVGEVWLYSDEGQHITYETDEPSFVNLDFSRSPELTEFERYQALAAMKREQRMEEIMANIERREALLAASEVKTNATETQDGNGPAGGSQRKAKAGTAAEPENGGQGQDNPAGEPGTVPA